MNYTAKIYIKSLKTFSMNGRICLLNQNISPASETLHKVKVPALLYDASTGRSGGGNFQLVSRKAKVIRDNDAEKVEQAVSLFTVEYQC